MLNIHRYIEIDGQYTQIYRLEVDGQYRYIEVDSQYTQMYSDRCSIYTDI